jgi:hypothetical protein
MAEVTQTPYDPYPVTKFEPTAETKAGPNPPVEAILEPLDLKETYQKINPTRFQK